MKLVNKNISFPKKYISKKVALGLVLAIFVLAVLFIFYVFSSSEDRRSQRLNNTFDRLAEENADCEKIIYTVGEDPAENYNNSTKKSLLELQLGCYSETGNMDQALLVAEKLKALYEEEGDSGNVRVMGMVIEDIKSEQSQQNASSQ